MSEYMRRFEFFGHWIEWRGWRQDVRFSSHAALFWLMVFVSVSGWSMAIVAWFLGAPIWQ